YTPASSNVWAKVPSACRGLSKSSNTTLCSIGASSQTQVTVVPSTIVTVPFSNSMSAMVITGSSTGAEAAASGVPRASVSTQALSATSAAAAKRAILLMIRLLFLWLLSFAIPGAESQRRPPEGLVTEGCRSWSPESSGCGLCHGPERMDRPAPCRPPGEGMSLLQSRYSNQWCLRGRVGGSPDGAHCGRTYTCRSEP